MKLLFSICILVFLLVPAFGQDPGNNALPFGNKNSVQFELGGHGLFYSFNYERVVLNGHRFKTTVQAGASYYPPQTDVIPVWIPLMANELFSFGNHHIEAGLGYVFTWEYIEKEFREAYSPWGGFFAGRIGYRYQKPSGRLVLRAGFTPLLEHRDWLDFHPLGGLAVGYCF